MALIPLTGGYSVIPEGFHVFRITGVTYKETFGKLEVKMETAKGQTHTERFSMRKADGSVNEGAMNAFSYFARRAMNDPELGEIEPEALVGHYIRCLVKHDIQPSTKNPGQTVTWVRLDEKEPADGFDDEAPTEPPKDKKTAKKFDLSSILGDGGAS